MYIPWLWKRKSKSKIGMSPVLKTIRKKVYCGDCEYFRKTKNQWYYLAGGGGQMSNEFNHFCDHPTNIKEVDDSYDTFEKREVRTRCGRVSPEVLNWQNKCHLYKAKVDEPDWEK
jgi:hypothetical protein